MGVFYRESRQRWSYQFRFGRKRFAGYCTEEDGSPCASRRAAERAEERVRVAVAEVRKAPAPMPGLGYTLAQALAAYAAQADRTLANWDNQRDYIAELLAHFGAETPLAAIDEARIWTYIDWARQQKLRVYTGGPTAAADAGHRKVWKQSTRTRSDGTINKYLICLRKTLRIAHGTRDALKRRLLADLPAVPNLKQPKRLPRPIGDADAGLLLRRAAPHAADAAALSLLLGLRRAEAYGATVRQVDFQNRGIWLAAEATKAGRGEFQPANADAMRLLERLVRQARERGVEHLVTWRPREKDAEGRPVPWRPVKNPRSAIRTALKKAGLEGKHRWHDLKGTYTTGLAHVAPGRVVQALSRHKSFATTELYIRVADEATRAAVDALAGRVAVAGLDLAAPLGEATTKATTKRASPKRRSA